MMPPLPSTLARFTNTGILHAALEEVVREYGKACRAHALAEAAEICNGEKWVSQTGAHSIRFIDTYNGACDDCAQAIKRLV